MNSRAVQRILDALRETPELSKDQIAERAFVGKTTLSGGGYLKAMKESGLIHISGWERNGSGGFSTPLYRAGPGADYPRPKVTVQNRNAPGMARILAAVQEFGPLDYRQVARIAELSPNTVKNAGYLDALVAQKKIHIVEWRRSRNGPMRPVYDAGPGRDAPQPQALSRAETSKRHRAKQLAVSGCLVSQLGALARHPNQITAG